MATRALSALLTPVAIIAAATTPLPAAANDTASCWTQDTRARLLLASCTKNPPSGTFHRQRFGNATDEWFAYVGYRAEALDAIRMEIGDKLLAAYHQNGEPAYGPFAIWCGQPDVTQAIDAALTSDREA